MLDLKDGIAQVSLTAHITRTRLLVPLHIIEEEVEKSRTGRGQTSLYMHGSHRVGDCTQHVRCISGG